MNFSTEKKKKIRDLDLEKFFESLSERGEPKDFFYEKNKKKWSEKRVKELSYLL